MLQPVMTPRFALEFTLLADIDEVMPRLCAIIEERSTKDEATLDRSNAHTGGDVWRAPDGTTAYWHYDRYYTPRERGALVARFQLAQADPACTQLAYVLESEQPPTTPHTPHTLQKLMRAFAGRIIDSEPDGRTQVVPTALEVVTAATMPRLINHLDDENRMLPVVVLSTTEGAVAEADELMGVASVWAYEGTDASQAFRRSVRGNHATFNGAARIFAPRFWERSDKPPYFSQDQWGQLRERLAQTTAALFVPTKAMLDAKRAYDTRDHVAYEVQTATQETQALLARSEDENNDLRVQNEQLRARVQQLEAQAEALENDLAEERARNKNLQANIHAMRAYAPTAQPDDADADDAPPTSVLEAVERAAEQFADVLVFHKRAHDSAADSPYKYPAKVWEALVAVAEVTRARQQPGGLGMSVKDAFRERGQDYSPHESQTTGNQNDYFVTHDGANLPIHEHVKLGVGDANVCLRIYMCWLDDAKTYLIGHVGRHLPNTMS